MRRLVALALLVVCSPAMGQTISVPKLTPLGQPIVAKVDGLPDGARVAWKASAGASVVNVGLGKAHVWGVTGGHSLTAVIAPADGELVWIDAPFAVGDAPPTPPPNVKTLADLAGKDTAALASIYAKLLADVTAGGYANVELFKATHGILLADLGLADNGAAAEIDKRLTVDSIDAIKLALESIVKELGNTPTPVPPGPPAPAGKRFVYIVRESEDDTPDMAYMFNALRTDEPARWLKEQGHELFIHDDDDQDQNGDPIPLVEQLEQRGPVPGIFVLDKNSGIVVHSQSLPRTAAEVIDVVKAH